MAEFEPIAWSLRHDLEFAIAGARVVTPADTRRLWASIEEVLDHHGVPKEGENDG